MDNLTNYLSGSDLRHQLSSSNDLRRCRVESSNVSFDTSIEKKFFIVMMQLLMEKIHRHLVLFHRHLVFVTVELLVNY